MWGVSWQPTALISVYSSTGFSIWTESVFLSKRGVRNLDLVPEAPATIGVYVKHHKVSTPSVTLPWFYFSTRNDAGQCFSMSRVQITSYNTLFLDLYPCDAVELLVVFSVSRTVVTLQHSVTEIKIKCKNTLSALSGLETETMCSR